VRVVVGLVLASVVAGCGGSSSSASSGGGSSSGSSESFTRGNWALVNYGPEDVVNGFAKILGAAESFAGALGILRTALDQTFCLRGINQSSIFGKVHDIVVVNERYLLRSGVTIIEGVDECLAGSSGY